MFRDLLIGTAQDSAYQVSRHLMSEQARMALREGFPELGLETVMDWSLGKSGYVGVSKPMRARMLDNAAPLRMQFLSEVPAKPFGCEQVAHLDCPVLYLEGERSPWHAHAMGDAFVRCRPEAERVVLKRVSHGMTWEDAKAFNRVVLQFLGRSTLATQ